MTEATLWCNGSTNDFGSFSRSSNLCGVAIFFDIKKSLKLNKNCLENKFSASSFFSAFLCYGSAIPQRFFKGVALCCSP